jgi:hypothetical protein
VTGRAILFEDPNFGGVRAVLDRGEANDMEWAHFTNPSHRAASIRVRGCAVPGLLGPRVSG